MTDAQIADAAREAGVSDAVSTTFASTVSGTFHHGAGNAHAGTWRTYAPGVYILTTKAQKDFGRGLGTPLVTINGQQFTGDLYTAGDLERAIGAAKR